MEVYEGMIVGENSREVAQRAGEKLRQIDATLPEGVSAKAIYEALPPDLKAKATDSVEFAGSAKVLGEFVDHHAGEEEKTMFKMARKLFSAEELAEFDEQYEQWKATPEAAREMANALKQPSPVPVGQ